MEKKEYLKLVAKYGIAKADRALAWFVQHHSENFRKSVHPAAYCITNEYLWI